MAQHLCIVARDNPLLLGYLSIALDYLTRGGDERFATYELVAELEGISVDDLLQSVLTGIRGS